MGDLDVPTNVTLMMSLDYERKPLQTWGDHANTKGPSWPVLDSSP